MKLIAIIAFMVLLINSCTAEPDNVIMGPYNISFDLGIPHDAYRITIKHSVETESLGGDKETRYSLFVENKTVKMKSFIIGITNYAEAQPDAFLSSKSLKALLRKSEPSANVAARTIDEKEGAVAQYRSRGTMMFPFSYYMDKYTWIYTISSFPWDEGTLSLLKTIHIEKINATA